MEPIAKNKIKVFRKEMRMKQFTLAQKVGVFQSEISEIETGKRKPSVYLALKIAGVLGKNINEIF
jgi:putative transcriptional regulator